MLVRRLIGMQFVELVLCEIGDLELGRAHHPAAFRLQPLGQQLRKGRFAVSVRAEQCDPVVVVDA